MPGVIGRKFGELTAHAEHEGRCGVVHQANEYRSRVEKTIKHGAEE
jgi:hypothetical protein